MIPRATYRLQFSRDFGFDDAAALVPYLAELGISHLYASPWLRARAGSRHGYDIIDHNDFNPELGGEAAFERLHAALRGAGLQQLLDFVPNHMGIARADNAYWLDVLEWGRASPFAQWFDIDWEPIERDLRNKVLLPFLGDHYGAVLERGELKPRFDPADGTFSVWYFDHRFPLAPHTYAELLRASATRAPAPRATRLEALARDSARLRVRAGSTSPATAPVREQALALKATLAAERSLHPALAEGAAALAAGDQGMAGKGPLHRLLERQAYRLAYWRVAADEINYRRFFDINDLAALRVENREVFAGIHALVARLLAEGKLDGLRIDHIDGLFDPARYCRDLRRLVPRPFYLVVEKILARHERLRATWPVHGTTGYDFLNQVTGLLVDPRGEAELTRACRQFTGLAQGFEETTCAAKLHILGRQLSGELQVLARRLHRIARASPQTRDYTRAGLTRAFAEVVAAFPVYRTYVDAHGAAPDDVRDIDWAIARARRHWDEPRDDIFDFIGAVLRADHGLDATHPRAAVLRLAMQVQQYTSPAMAKGFEDTALYRWPRLLALNDVGGDPGRFGMSVAAFHHANLGRARLWPHSMLATATHDTKRGEDLRARLAALAELAPQWSRACRRWRRLNRGWKSSVGGARVPHASDEYVLYQTLLGAWPLELMEGAWDEAVAARFSARIRAYMTKAVREAKLRSSWRDPDKAYEAAQEKFIERLLDRDSGSLFLEAFLPLQQAVALAGLRNSLVQSVLKLTCPGVPDIYQGCELWDYNLVDPDNRRPVDFRHRASLMERARAWDAAGPAARRELVAGWHRHWHDGTIKLHLLRRLLALRKACPRLFLEGDYRPVALHESAEAIAFARNGDDGGIFVAALLHPADPVAAAQALADAVADAAAATPFDVLGSGARVPAGNGARAMRALAALPVVVLADRPVPWLRPCRRTR